MKKRISEISQVLGLALALAQATAAFAVTGGDVGNGGDSVRIKGKLYVLDLVEAGVEDAPYLDPAAVADPEHETLLAQALSNLPQVPTSLLAKKISEIYRVDKVLATSLVATIRFFDWRTVNTDLVDVQDEYSPIQFSRSDVIQVAIRTASTIRVSKAAWLKLDPVNQVALILHEAAYALVKPDEIGGNGSGISQQSSPRARQLVGYFFTSNFGTLGHERLERVADPYFPLIGDNDDNDGLVRIVSSGLTQFEMRFDTKIELYVGYNDFGKVVPREVMGAYLHHVSAKRIPNEVYNFLTLYCGQPTLLSSVYKEGGYRENLYLWYSEGAVSVLLDRFASPQGQREYAKFSVVRNHVTLADKEGKPWVGAPAHRDVRKFGDCVRHSWTMWSALPRYFQEVGYRP